MPPRERSRCRGPGLKVGPTDTEGRTWGGQGSHQNSSSHPAGQRRPGPAKILPSQNEKFTGATQRHMESAVMIVCGLTDLSAEAF